jgi:hypothetical protein
LKNLDRFAADKDAVLSGEMMWLLEGWKDVDLVFIISSQKKLLMYILFISGRTAESWKSKAEMS